MDTKKAKKASLEDKRVLFFEIGMTVVLAITLIAFEWSTPAKDNHAMLIDDYDNVAEEIVLNTVQEKKKEVIPPAIPSFELILNTSEESENIPDINVEIDPGDAVQYWLPEEVDEPDEVPFYAVEEKPGFGEGSLNEFHRYIQEQVEYPVAAVNLGIEGRLSVTFVVDKNGNLTNINFIRGVDPLLENEVSRVMKNAPKWKPGKQRGMPVDVSFSMPVIFQLERR